MALTLFPTHYEAEPFLDSLENCVKYDMDLCPAWIGECGRVTTHVVIIGMGLPHCVTRTQHAIELLKPKQTYLCGFAGGLDPKLARGDLLTDTPELTQLHTVESPVAAPEAKAALFEKTQKPAVDMESAHVAAITEQLGAPLKIIRAISDTAAEVLPPFLDKGYDQAKGKTTPMRMAAHMA
ncbi:MAG: hypothetical protein AAGA45_03630, partial [Verrucomicrobiota bacterium]